MPTRHVGCYSSLTVPKLILNLSAGDGTIWFRWSLEQNGPSSGLVEEEIREVLGPTDAGLLPVSRLSTLIQIVRD